MPYISKDNWKQVRNNWMNPSNPIKAEGKSVSLKLVPSGSKDKISTILEVFVSGEYFKEGRSIKARQRFSVKLQYTPTTIGTGEGYMNLSETIQVPYYEDQNVSFYWTVTIDGESLDTESFNHSIGSFTV